MTFEEHYDFVCHIDVLPTGKIITGSIISIYSRKIIWNPQTGKCDVDFDDKNNLFCIAILSND